MKMRVLLAVSSLFLLQSCMIYELFQQDPIAEEPFWEEGNTNQLSQEIIKNGPPPVYVDGGIADDKLYAGLPNDIKVYVEGGSTAHLEVFANSGRLDTVDKTQGLYTFTEKIPGFVAEIVARDPITGQMAAKVFDVVSIPAPNAYIGKYKTGFSGKLNFTAEEFKQQNAVILQHDNVKVPVRCAANTYTIIRIGESGKRETCENTSKSGTFDEAGKKLIAEAKKGDVYIFKSIKSDCSQAPIKDIVYVIE